MAEHWREMEAGLPLDRLIAERLGWRELQEDEVWRDNREGLHYFRALEGVAPDIEEDHEFHSYVPQYSTDLNAALSLPIHPLQIWTLVIRPDRYATAQVKESIVSSRRNLTKEGELADTPALAVCRAWLSYSEHGAKGSHVAKGKGR